MTGDQGGEEAGRILLLVPVNNAGIFKVLFGLGAQIPAENQPYSMLYFS